MKRTHHHHKTLNTTIGELAAAFYEAALAELHDERAAAALAQELLSSFRFRRV